MRAANSCPRHHRCLRRRRARPWITQQNPGAKHAPRVSPIPYSPGIPDTEFLRPRCRDIVRSLRIPTGISDTIFPGYPRYRIPASALPGSCPIIGDPSRAPIVSPSGGPTLINGPVIGLWPRTCSTHPLSVAYHRCCSIPPGLLTNNMNFF